MWSYNRYRDPDVQEDLNKLYDTRPSTKNPYGNNDNSPYYGHNGDTERNTAAVPTFDLSESGDVTAVLNKPALLNCRVKSIGNKTVRMMETNYASLFISICFMAKCGNVSQLLHHVPFRRSRAKANLDFTQPLSRL